MRARAILKMQRLGLLHLGPRAHLGEHLGGKTAVDLDQRDGIAAGHFATDMEGGDIDVSLAHMSTTIQRRQ